MNNNFINLVNVASFIISTYALYIALENLQENRQQNGELKQILSYLENHLQDQDNHLIKQDELITNLMKGE